MNIENISFEEIALPEEFDGLPAFVVGGFVRDKLRGVEPTDADLMVAEVSPEEMRERGFREIDSPNNDTFAVFHDSFGREVAIAREETSTGDGHRDFDVTPVPPDVPASEAVSRDLQRRDFTINSMAVDLRHGVLHDPYGGVMDLVNSVIRAVSASSFEEDPLRIIRGARFAARIGADLDETTAELMRDSVQGIVDLPEERIRMELEKALVQSEDPQVFFDVLSSVDALELTYPEAAALRGVPAGPKAYHKEGDSYEHTMKVIRQMKELRPNDSLALLMALGHDFGKASTPKEEWPSHSDHAKRGVKIVDEMASRLSMSNEQRKAMREASMHHMTLLQMDDLRESTVIDLWENLRLRDRMFDLMIADARGRTPPSDAPRWSFIVRMAAAKIACEEWTGSKLIEEGYRPEDMGGEEFGNLLRQKRVEEMRAIES